MEHIGFVEAEGGPLLVIDATLARSWKGIDGDDYERAGEFFDLHPDAAGGVISVGSSSALLWEMSGAGTADIYWTKDKGIVVMRAWLAKNAEASVLKNLLEEPTGELADLGKIEVSSGAVVILWATENGQSVDGSVSQQVRRPQSLNLDNAGLIVPIMPGKYEAKHDSVKWSGSEARRLHLMSCS